MFPPELQGPLDRQARAWRRVEVLRDIADNEDGGGLGSVDLYDLYVPAWLCPDPDVRGAQERERALYRRLHDPELNPDERAQVAQAHASNLKGQWNPERRVLLRISPIAALTEHRHVAVVAPPGAGKSTLLRIVALAQIDPTFVDPWGEAETSEPPSLPVLLRLADYAGALRDEPDLALAAFIVRVAAHAEAPLRAGQALLLLDGLDEVPSLELRKRIASAIRALLDAVPKLRCVVTTRPNGAVHLPDFAVFHLDLFTEDMAVEFLARWRACQRRARGVTEEPATQRAEAAATWQRLRRHPSLVELARNPLLLAILAVCQDAQVELPHDRVQFYARTLRTLLGTWDHARAEDDELPVTLEVQWRAWGELALELRATCPTGVFRRELLVERLVAWLVVFRVSEADGRRLAEGLFDAAVHRHGLFERRGGGDFAFWHPTFGEYLAATAIARDRDPRRLIALREDQRNAEIAAMALAHLATVQGDRRRVNTWLTVLAREDNDSWGPLLAPALEFAVSCVLRGCAADHAGIEGLLGLAARRIIELPYGSWSAAFSRLVDGQPRFCPGPALVAALLPLSRTPREVGTAWARPSAMRLLANACATDRTARDACRRVATSWREGQELFGGRESVGYAALGLLRAGELASAWLPAISGLVWFRNGGDGLEPTDDGRTLRDALKRLAPALGERLADAEPEVRRAAALALALLDDARPAVVDALFAAETTTHTQPLESSLLARLARSDAAVRQRLVVHALHTEAKAEPRDTSWAGACLARALGAAGQHCNDIVRQLVDALSGELERADGPGQKLLERLLGAPERPHLAGPLVAEAHARLLADPDATCLALRCVLHTGSYFGSLDPPAIELLFVCVRRGDIDQRLVAHEKLDHAFYQPDFVAQRGRFAAVEVELLAAALGHDARESVPWSSGWETRHAMRAHDLPRTWGELVTKLARSIEHRLESSRDEQAPHLVPLREVLASPHERLRHYAAVLLAPVTAEDDERARLVPILVELLASRDPWLRARGAAWLVDRRGELAAAHDVAILPLQLALCAEHSILSRSPHAERVARLGPPSDEVIHALMHDECPAGGVDPTWLFARIEVVELLASYLGDEDDRLHHRAHDLLERGRGRDDVSEALYRRGLAAEPEDTANLATRLGMDLEGLDKPRDPRVTELWRRALAATHLAVKARAFGTVVWRCSPDIALRDAALTILDGESLFHRVLVVYDCLLLALREQELPAEVGSCDAGLQAFGVPAERLIAALLPILDDPGLWLRAAAAVMLHVLAGPREQVSALLGPLRGVHTQFHEHFSLWGPDWYRLTELVVPRQIRECYDCLGDVGGWTLAVQAAGLGAPDDTLSKRLLAELRAALAGSDDFASLRRADLLLRMMLASSPDTAALGLDEVFSGLCVGVEDEANQSVDRRCWRLVEHFRADDRVLARAVEHVLRRWPAALERQHELASRGAPVEHLDRLRAAVRTFVQAPEPALRGAAARWCVQLGEHDPRVLDVWVECLFSESVVGQVFSSQARLWPEEADRGAGHACEHPEQWRDSPGRTRALLALLGHCKILPRRAAALIRAALASSARGHRIAAADLCVRYPEIGAADEVAPIWRDLLATVADDDACEVADHLLKVAPADPAALAVLRRVAAGDDSYAGRHACEALAAFPSEFAFLRELLARRSEDWGNDSRNVGWMLAQLVRVGEPPPAVARRAIAAVLAERLDPSDLAADAATRGFSKNGPPGWPMARGMELAQVRTHLDDAIAAELAACIDADITAVGPLWRRLASSDPCPPEAIREVIALLTVRHDDDDRRLLARGYWYQRLPHDAQQQGLVLPKPTPPRLPADPLNLSRDEMLRALLCSLFAEADLRRFLGSGEQGDEVVRALPGSIASHAVLVDGAVAELERRGLTVSLWPRLRAKFPGRITDIDRVAAVWTV